LYAKNCVTYVTEETVRMSHRHPDLLPYAQQALGGWDDAADAKRP
jgi:hypothetical protein